MNGPREPQALKMEEEDFFDDLFSSLRIGTTDLEEVDDFVNYIASLVKNPTFQARTRGICAPLM